MVTLPVSTPADFQFRAVVESHGWYQLAPFSYDAQRSVLSRRIRLDDGKIATLCMRGAKSRSILVDVIGPQVVTSIQRNLIGRAVRLMFNLDRDLRPFYQQMSRTKGYEWVDQRKAGRMLACPTVWEDLVKTLLTTNTSWNNTREMAARLVALDPDGLFPAPQQIAALSEAELAEHIGLGYRAPYLHELAQSIANGLDVEKWRDLDSDELFRAVSRLHGYGDYAAGTVLRLLGHYDRLAVDSVARKAFERLTGQKSDGGDAEMRAYYEKFGEWRGLVLWMDCIRDENDTAVPAS